MPEPITLNAAEPVLTLKPDNDYSTKDTYLGLSGGPYWPLFTLRLTNRVGQRAVVDFEGDSVTYSGDLPIDESARLLFEAVFCHIQEQKEPT